LAIALEDIASREPAVEILAQLRGDRQARQAIAMDLFTGSRADAMPFGELLRGLAALGSPALDQLGVGVRATNVLGRIGVLEWAGFAQISPQALRLFPNLGRGTFIAIVDAVLLAWSDRLSTDPTFLANLDVHAVPAPEAEPADPSPPSLRAPLRIEVIADLATVMAHAWDRGATTFAEALKVLRRDEELSADAADALRRLRSEQLSDALGYAGMGALDWQALTAFDERDSAILAERMYATGRRPTLDDLAQRFGVTRERIRQREREIAKTLDARLGEPGARPVHHLAARLREAGGLFDQDGFANVVDELLPGIERVHREIVIAAAGRYVDWHGFRAREEIANMLDLIAAAYRKLGPGTRIEPEQLETLATFVRPTPLSTRLLDALGLRLIEDVLVVEGRTQPEKAMAVLGAVGRPLAFDEIHLLAGFELSPRSLRGAMLNEPGLMRRGKDSFGLRAWGGEEYSGIVEELEQAIERAGGQVDLDEVVGRFAREFGVNDTSVRAYAKNPRFVLRSDGRLMMRGAEDPEIDVVHVAIESTPGTVRIDAVWHLRYEVDADALRWSGRPVRKGVAQALGLEPGLMIGIEYDGGPVTFSWRSIQPSIGSMRAVILHHACAAGDLLLIPLSGAEPRPVRVVRGRDRQQWSGVQRLGVELGLDPTEIEEQEQPLEVSEALGLPLGADWYEIVDHLRDRGDKALLGHLPEHLT
jgi:hypothetical protein